MLTAISPDWYRHLHAPNLSSGHLVAASPLPTRSALHQPVSDTIRIRWRPHDVAPAATGGQICVTEKAHGRMCAVYVQNERPADVLARHIRNLGLTVESADR